MEARSSSTVWYSSASLASISRAWASCALMSAPLAGEVGARLAPSLGVVQFPGSGGLLCRQPHCIRAVRLVVNDHNEALMRGVVAPGTGVVGVAEPVVRGVEEPLEHHRVRHAGEVQPRVPVRSGGWQLAGGAVVGFALVVAMRFLAAGRWWPGRSSYAATSVLADEAYAIAVLRMSWGTVAREPCAPPWVRLSSRRWARRVVRRHARPGIVPSALVESAGRSVVGVVVSRGLQRPLGRALGRQHQVRRGPALVGSITTDEARRGW
jgi:hypothetical protein